MRDYSKLRELRRWELSCHVVSIAKQNLEIQKTRRWDLWTNDYLVTLFDISLETQQSARLSISISIIDIVAKFMSENTRNVTCCHISQFDDFCRFSRSFRNLKICNLDDFNLLIQLKISTVANVCIDKSIIRSCVSSFSNSSLKTSFSLWKSLYCFIHRNIYYNCLMCVLSRTNRFRIIMIIIAQFLVC